MAAGRWTLGWPGVAPGGGRVRQGIYQARVTVDGRPLVRRFVVLQ